MQVFVLSFFVSIISIMFKINISHITKKGNVYYETNPHMHAILYHMKIRIQHPFDYYILLFFTTAFTGWLWEVILYLITAHSFVNRGIYRGPYLPIYGVGGVILMLILHKFRRYPFRVFFISCFLCTILEYFTGKWLERKWNVRWWDYSGHLWNIDGHVCLTSTIAFGFCGILLICIFQPVFNKLYHHMTLGIRAILCIICILIFIADAAYSASLPNTGHHISTAINLTSHCQHDIFDIIT